MKDFSKTTVILGTAFCAVIILINPVSANKPLQLSNTNIQHSINLSNNATYTASGKMDKKTATMLINLLRNPHLQVRASINGQPLQTINPQVAKPSIKAPIDRLINYTITGKTDKATALQLKRLIQNSTNVDVDISTYTPPNASPKSMTHSNAPQTQIHPQFIGGYTPFYSATVPPVYAQGNIVWMPIPINIPASNLPATSAEMTSEKKI